MKTLNQIRDEVAGETGYGSFELYVNEIFRSANSYTVERITMLTDEVARRYSKEVAKEALKNASVVGNALRENGDLVREIILNESNIPKL